MREILTLIDEEIDPTDVLRKFLEDGLQFRLKPTVVQAIIELVRKG
jgi:hypothetical protein